MSSLIIFLIFTVLSFGTISAFPYVLRETENDVMTEFERFEDMLIDALRIQPDDEDDYDDDDEDFINDDDDSIPEVAEEMGATEYLDYLKRANLKETLMGHGPFTAFGPTNKVFESLTEYVKKMLNNETSLVRIMKYGVMMDKMAVSTIKNDMMMPTMLGGENKIRFNIYQEGKVMTASGRRIVTPGKMASNGMFYEVMGLPEPPTGTITFSMNNWPTYKKLAAAMKTCGMDEMLNGEGPFTMFAPTDKGFAKIPKETLNDLMKNSTALKELLMYHVVKGTYYSAAWSGEDKATTLSGKELKINTENDKCTVNSIPVTTPDTTVTNGVVHGIDDVIMPPTAHLRLVLQL